MVNELLLAVTHQPDVASAWRSLVAPKDKVGIKISAAGGELFTTHRDVVNAIVDGLVAAGQTRTNIIVWDQLARRNQGRPATRARKVTSYSPSRPARYGYDPKVTISAPFLGNLIWGDYEYLGGRGEVPLLSDEEEHQQPEPPRSDRHQRGHENHQRAGAQQQRAQRPRRLSLQRHHSERR